jgi:hypothetical protein
LVTQDKEGKFILIKGAIHQMEIKIINIYVSNISVPNFIKHTLKKLKAHIDSNTVVMRDFNTPLSSTDRSSRQKIHKEILNDSIDQMDLTDIYRIFHLTMAHYIFISAAHENFFKIDHILWQKVSLNK